MTELSDGMKDFSSNRIVQFNINKGDGTPETFHGVPELPALLLVEFAAMTEQLENAPSTEQPKIFSGLFSLVLTDESAARFNARMSDKENPIAITQIDLILPWIMEEYGMRPTQPSEDSSPGSVSPDDGKNLTANVQPTVLMSEPSPDLVSST